MPSEIVVREDELAATAAIATAVMRRMVRMFVFDVGVVGLVYESGENEKEKAKKEMKVK